MRRARRAHATRAYARSATRNKRSVASQNARAATLQTLCACRKEREMKNTMVGDRGIATTEEKGEQHVHRRPSRHRRAGNAVTNETPPAGYIGTPPCHAAAGVRHVQAAYEYATRTRQHRRRPLRKVAR